MRKHIIGLIVLVLCLFMLTPTAFAEDVKVNVTADPTELSEAGIVNFSFEISNNSPYELHNVTITYLGTVFDIMEQFSLPPIGMGNSVSGIVLPLQVPDSQLGQPIVFTVGWLQGGEPFTKDVECTIARAANPVISITRTASAETAKQGDIITLTYELINDTKFDMSDIVLIDENLSDTPIFQKDVLKANASTSVTHQYRMGTESVVSSPVVTYVVNGKSKVFSSITPMTLTMMLVQLEMKVDMGVPTAAGVTFTLEVKNTGTQTIRDIQIADERGTPVNSAPFMLAAGDSGTYPFLVVPLMTEPIRKVTFQLNGTDPFGDPYTLESPASYEVYPFVDESQIRVSMRAETVTPWSSETGIVTARLILTNYSVVDLTNIVITESTIGVVKTADTLASGETSFDVELLIGSPRNLQFTVKANDPTGTVRELATTQMQVAYAEGTDLDHATPEPSKNAGRAFAFLSTTISKILVVLGVLMVLAFIALVVLSVMDRGRSDRVRYDDDDDDDELDRIFDEDHDVLPEDDEVSDVEYFTKRIARVEQQQEQQSPPIQLPAPSVAMEVDAPEELTPEELMPDEVFKQFETENASPPTADPVFDGEPAVKLSAEDDWTEPGHLPTPKVFTARPVPVKRPAARGQIHYVQHDDEDTRS